MPSGVEHWYSPSAVSQTVKWEQRWSLAQKIRGPNQPGWCVLLSKVGQFDWDDLLLPITLTIRVIPQYHILPSAAACLPESELGDFPIDSPAVHIPLCLYQSDEPLRTAILCPHGSRMSPGVDIREAVNTHRVEE